MKDKQIPFALSLSKGSQRPFEKLHKGFDRLSPNGALNYENVNMRTPAPARAWGPVAITARLLHAKIPSPRSV